MEGNEVDLRSGQQTQADAEQVFSENNVKIVTKENIEACFKAGWSALNYTATKLRKLVYFCDAKDSENKQVVPD